ncbi:hypothetical protein [Scleromatobacter humisilvae]|uniref:Uncharacterized protein n=1 Tax=Scleromatobacter humisilvae TaxID=2897159 RepID=A0A9X1YNZ3_9BURK|nr:hypothetical protein [Scleromatobacter humisilvae]MCK9688465.1 hypothetical protein [Scleromatobacter humisilvae]
MTDQVLDDIFHAGLRHLLADDPLSGWSGLPEIVGLASDNIRGYEAAWAIVGARLFLVAFSGISSDQADVDIEHLFPGADSPAPPCSP